MRWTTPLGVAFLGAALYGAAGCATRPAPIPPVAAPVCLPMRSYSPAEQKALADQLETLPQDSPVSRAFIDYERLRDADRACQASQK